MPPGVDRLTPLLRRAGRQGVAFGLALAAAVLAAVGAVLPAVPERVAYSWPPPEVTDSAPSMGWVAPLLVNRGTVERITVALPCEPPRMLPRPRSSLVLATASTDGLRIVLSRGSYRVSVGDTPLVTLSHGANAVASGPCPIVLDVTEDSFTAHGGTSDGFTDGMLDGRPRVTGFVSEVDLRHVTELRVTVVPVPQDSHPSGAQMSVRVASFVLLAVALVVLWRAPGGTQAARRARRLAAALRPVDGVVVTGLLGWTVLAPPFYDDGWAEVRQENAAFSGGFSNYYDLYGVNLPLGTWFEWLSHHVTTRAPELVIERFPVTLTLIVGWGVARWCFTRSREGTDTRPALVWGLAAAYGCLAMAWGMTLRPEPVVSLLVVVTLACALVIAGDRAALERPAAVASVAIGFSLAAHPAGVVALAPVLIVGPEILRRARRRGLGGWTAIATSVVVAGTTTVLLAFMDADLAARRDQATVIGDVDQHDWEWRAEIGRWADLASAPQLRRLAAALLVLAVVGFVTRRGRRYPQATNVASPALALGIVLLTVTPSKWIWHFGALSALAAVAVATEAAVLAGELARRERGAGVRLVLAIAVVATVTVWSWEPVRNWGAFDLVSADAWDADLWNTRLSATTWALLGTAAVLLGITFWWLSRAGKAGLADAGTSVARWLVVAMLAPAMTVTTLVLVSDAFATDGWTFTRQNVEALVGDSSCGLASELRATVPGSVTPLKQFSEIVAPDPPSWIPDRPAGSLDVFPVAHAQSGTEASTGWYGLPRRTLPAHLLGAEVFGRTLGTEHVMVEWGRFDPRTRGVVTLTTSEHTVPERLTAAWSIAPIGRLTSRPQGADAIRLRLRSDEFEDRLALGPAVGYRSAPLDTLLQDRKAPSLVAPLHRPFLPCAHLPEVADGRAELPRIALTDDDDDSFPLYDPTSPFAGLTDFASIHRLTIFPSDRPRLLAHEIVIPDGWRLLPVE